MASIYGAVLFKTPHTAVDYASGVTGKNSEVFASGDPVQVTAAHGLAVTGATTAVVGVIVKTQTMTSTNETVAGVQPSFIPSELDYEFLMGTNANLSTLTSPGAYYGLTGATGAVQVDVTTGVTTTTSRVVQCTKVDPNNIGDLTQGLFKFTKVLSTLTN